MIEIPFGKCKICLHFSFFASVTLLILCSESVYAVYSLYACLLHECGHLIMMILLRQRVKKLVFYGAGIKIIPYKNCEADSFIRQILILLAGCTVNFTLYAVSALLGEGEKAVIFGAANLAIGLFNILPLNFLDGGKFLIQLFYKMLKFENAVKAENYLRNVNIIIVPCAAVLLYIAGVRNFTIYVTLIFLLFTSVML